MLKYEYYLHQFVKKFDSKITQLNPNVQTNAIFDYMETVQVDGDAVRLFYRIPECPDAHKTWVQLGEKLPTALCCEEGLYEPCYGFDCECYKGENRG